PGGTGKSVRTMMHFDAGVRAEEPSVSPARGAPQRKCALSGIQDRARTAVRTRWNRLKEAAHCGPLAVPAPQRHRKLDTSDPRAKITKESASSGTPSAARALSATCGATQDRSIPWQVPPRDATSRRLDRVIDRGQSRGGSRDGPKRWRRKKKAPSTGICWV